MLTTIIKLLILSCYYDYYNNYINKNLPCNLFVSSLQQHQQNNYVIKVCQNKNCMKQFISSTSGSNPSSTIPSSSSDENLMNVFRMLLDNDTNKNILIESSGCLSKCGNGPNININKNKNKPKGLSFLLPSSSSDDNNNDKEVSNVKDVYSIANILKEECDYECPSLLLAATDVIQQTNDSCKYVCVFKQFVIFYHVCKYIYKKQIKI